MCHKDNKVKNNLIYGTIDSLIQSYDSLKHKQFNTASTHLYGKKTRWPPRVFFTFIMEFCWPSTAKDIIDIDLKFAGYVPY